MAFRLQELIHKYEEGAGSRYLKLLLGFFFPLFPVLGLFPKGGELVDQGLELHQFPP